MMTVVTSDHVAQLRKKTGAGIMECKKALQEAHGDMEKAIAWLRERGSVKALQRAGRTASEGMIYSYIHAGNKIGVLLELNCETDFVARTEDFKQLALELSLQIAAANPLWISRSDVPADIIAKEKEIYQNQCINEKKSGAVVDKIVDGKLEKYYAQVCLLEQPHIRDSSGKITVKSLIDAAIAKTGENIVLRRFVRFQLGGE
jgi:elongation factor Ts